MTWTHRITFEPLDPYVVGIIVFVYMWGLLSMLHYGYMLFVHKRVLQDSQNSDHRKAEQLCDFLQQLPLEQAVALANELRYADPVMYILVTSVLHERLSKSLFRRWWKW